MSFLQNIVELITSQPGDLVYHLISLFAVQIIVTLALGHWRRNRRDPLAIQIAVLGGALFAIECLLAARNGRGAADGEPTDHLELEISPLIELLMKRGKARRVGLLAAMEKCKAEFR